MRRILLVPIASLAALALAGVELPASAATSAAGAPTLSQPTSRDVTAIQQAERAAHSSKLKPLATTAASYTPLQDVYPVGKTMGFTVDRAKGTPARKPNRALSYRNLPISIWYPAASGPISSSDTFWATARSGNFPLIVFAPGFNSTPDTYQVFLHDLAAQGYIVAAPTFPIEAPIAGMAPASRSNTEMIYQIYDMSAVITQMITYAKTPGNFLSGAMNPSLVGVVGHSDGGMTVAGMTMSTSYVDARIKTAVVMSGAGPYGLTWRKRKVVPLLIEQANKDPYNSPSSAAWLFNSVTGPRAYLDLNGVYHIWPLNGNDKIADLTRRTVISHLNGQLKGGGLGSFFAQLASGNVTGYTRLRFAS
jgi:dienelactone hydrolase